MKKYQWLLASILIGLSFFSSWGYCEENKEPVLRVAILDNPNLPEKLWMWSQYENAYLAGVETAVLAAKKQGVKVEYKAFFYGTQPLDVLEKIPQVKEWNPDLILGPHYSNQFLLLKKYFPDTLVLSSYASDPAIGKLPYNFYSIFPPDTIITKALTQFIQAKYPNKNMHMIIQAECKDCVDTGKLLSDSYLKLNKKSHVTTTEFVGDNLQSIDIAKIAAGYKKGDIIFLDPLNYYLYINLTARIADYLKEPHLVFFTVLDSWGDSDAPLKSMDQNPAVKYDAYRISSLLLDDQSEDKLHQFNQLFSEHYGELSTDPLSYMTYLSVMSAVSAVTEFPGNNTNLSMKEQILVSFKKALAYDPNWYRPRTFGVYQYSNYSAGNGEVLVKTIPAFK